MKKKLSLLFFLVVSSQVLANNPLNPINFNTAQEWKLESPIPTNTVINSNNNIQSIVIHVNRNFKTNHSVIPDPIELICGDKHVFLKAGATGSCDLTTNGTASFGIKTSDFRNGSEGTVTFIELAILK